MDSTATATRLLEQGLPVIRFGQGITSMSPAAKEAERLILSRRLAHDGSPVMRWCLSNVAVEQDAGGLGCLGAGVIGAVPTGLPQPVRCGRPLLQGCGDARSGALVVCRRPAALGKVLGAAAGGEM